jgi:IQ motif/SEC7 domain-containing protein
MNEINLIIFNARNEHDRTKFCEDLKEAILEMNEMEGLRIQSEVEKVRSSTNSLVDITNNNGVVSSLIDYPTNKRERPLSRTLSNSLLDMTLNHQPLPCRTSQCSLDSGMVNKSKRFVHVVWNTDLILFTTKKCPFDMILWLLSGCG